MNTIEALEQLETDSRDGEIHKDEWIKACEAVDRGVTRYRVAKTLAESRGEDIGGIYSRLVYIHKGWRIAKGT